VDEPRPAYRPTDRPTERATGRPNGALRNVIASKFDSHVSVADGNAVAPVFTAAAVAAARLRRLKEFLLPATSPRTFTHTGALSHSHSRLSSPQQAETMSGALSGRPGEPDCKFSLSFFFVFLSSSTRCRRGARCSSSGKNRSRSARLAIAFYITERVMSLPSS